MDEWNELVFSVEATLDLYYTVLERNSALFRYLQNYGSSLWNFVPDFVNFATAFRPSQVWIT